MPYSNLNKFESEVLQCAIDGKIADFRELKDSSGVPVKAHLRGHVIRDLMIGLFLPPKSRAHRQPRRCSIGSAGIHLCGARIEGVIDLADTSGDTENRYFPLLLEDCDLMGEGSYDDPSARPLPALNARHARLARLSLKNCRAGFIDLTDTEIMGDLEIEGLSALSEGGQCRVAAAGLRIDGSLNAANSKLNVRQTAVTDSDTTLAIYALDIKDAEIAGSILLRPGFVANGGVNIGNACIKGDLWADGAHLIAQENFALRGQSARVTGIVGLTCQHRRRAQGRKSISASPTRFRAEGGISLMGACVGNLLLTGALLSKKEGELENFLNCASLTVEQDVYLDQWRRDDNDFNSWLTPFESSYGIYFEGAKISGAVHAEGAKFNNLPEEWGFIGVNLEVGGNLDLKRTNAGNLLLTGAKIHQDLVLAETHFSAVQANDIKIDGNVIWGGKLNSRASFRGAQVGGEFRIGEDKQNILWLMKDLGSLPEVVLEDAQINRDLKISKIEVMQSNRVDWTKYPNSWVRNIKLACYENGILHEAVFEKEESNTKDFILVSFIKDDSSSTIIFLDGSRPTINNVNTKAKLRLENAEQASDYLKFFCANIWTDAGPFRIVESNAETGTFIKAAETDAFIKKDNLPNLEITAVEIKKDSSDNSWQAEAFVLYDKKLFKALFKISLSGNVEMTQDEYIADVKDDSVTTYLPPVRIIRSKLPERNLNSNEEVLNTKAVSDQLIPVPEIKTPDSWSSLSPEIADDLKSKITRLIEFKPSVADSREERKPLVNLKGLKIGSLDDNHGLNWGDSVRLDLDGFEYERFDAPISAKNNFLAAGAIIDDQQNNSAKNRLIRFINYIIERIRTFIQTMRSVPAWQHRLNWINKQYVKTPPSGEEFKPEIYEQAAKVFRTEGNFDDALMILLEKLRLERKTRYSRLNPQRFVFWVIDRFFGYGILWRPVLVTFLTCWIFGWVCIDFANYGYLRWAPVGSGGTRIVKSLSLPRPVLVVDALPVSTLALAEDVEGAPSTFLATEPIIQSSDGRFAKEITCGDQIESSLYALDTFVPLLDLKQESKCTISSEDDAWLWRIAKSGYAILGWIVTSALILTLSGVVRRQIER